jgi:hypothetical protein
VVMERPRNCLGRRGLGAAPARQLSISL